MIEVFEKRQCSGKEAVAIVKKGTYGYGGAAPVKQHSTRLPYTSKTRLYIPENNRRSALSQLDRKHFARLFTPIPIQGQYTESTSNRLSSTLLHLVCPCGLGELYPACTQK